MDLKTIKRVIEMVEEANISHLSLEIEGTKIEVRKDMPQPHALVQPTPIVMAPTTPLVAPQATSTPETHLKPADTAGLVAIKSQMVGTFYAASKPDAAPYVKVGDTISPGQVLCVVEAMKLFNEIECEISGTIEKICVENGTPIEYGQELFLVRP